MWATGDLVIVRITADVVISSMPVCESPQALARGSRKDQQTKLKLIARSATCKAIVLDIMCLLVAF